MTTCNSGVIVVNEISNVHKEISTYRIQSNGHGKHRLLIPCFFGLFWKTVKYYQGWYDGGDFYPIIFESKEAVCKAIESFNSAHFAEERNRRLSKDWRDRGKCC